MRPGKDDHAVQSFAKVFSTAPSVARGSNASIHGHTGFAWAARREFFDECGLYEASLTGSGDHLRATVSAPQFDGLSRIDQHRLVKAAVKGRFDDGTIHALSVKTSLPG